MLVLRADGAAGVVEVEDEEEEDEYDVRPAENVLAFLESVRLDRKVEEKKWQDKVAALDSILDAVKKIVKLSGDWRDYVDTVQILKRFVGDSNQAVRALDGVLQWLFVSFMAHCTSCCDSV
jgi:hypothetical protein